MSDITALIEHLTTVQGIKRRAVMRLEDFKDACIRAGRVLDKTEQAYLADAFNSLDECKGLLDDLIEYMENA